MSDHDFQEKPSDLFTRLSVAMCPDDDGTRPVDPEWEGADVGWQSPAIQFSEFPITETQPTNVLVTVRNYGTSDATGAWLEVAYNLWIGNEPEANQAIGTVNLATIPAGGSTVASVSWTPPDLDTTHACVHARAFDIYSLLTFPGRCQSWNSYENPQAGNRNVRLVLIEDDSEPLGVRFIAGNPLPGPMRARVLITNLSRLQRFRGGIEDRYPLPFYRAPEARGVRVATRGRDLIRGARGAAVPSPHGTALWPRADIREEFRHTRFGVASKHFRMRNGSASRLSHGHVVLERGTTLSSHATLSLAGESEQTVDVVIPPGEFPARGRREIFQLDYQVGHARPIQHFIYLTR